MIRGRALYWPIASLAVLTVTLSLWALAVWRLEALASARHGLAGTSSAMVATPSSGTLAATNFSSAIGRLQEQIRLRARAEGVDVAMTPVADAGDHLVGVTLKASGAQPSLLRFANAVETGTPAIRFRSWRVEGAAGTLQLTGEAVAAWTPLR